MFDFSPIQILLVLGIALLVLGPKRLPEMGRGLGRGLRGFRDALTGNDRGDDVAADTAVLTEAAEAAPVGEPAPVRALTPAG